MSACAMIFYSKKIVICCVAITSEKWTNLCHVRFDEKITSRANMNFLFCFYSKEEFFKLTHLGFSNKTWRIIYYLFYRMKHACIFHVANLSRSKDWPMTNTCLLCDLKLQITRNILNSYLRHSILCSYLRRITF